MKQIKIADVKVTFKSTYEVTVEAPQIKHIGISLAQEIIPAHLIGLKSYRLSYAPNYVASAIEDALVEDHGWSYDSDGYYAPEGK